MEFLEERCSSGVVHSSNVIALIDIGSSCNNSESCYEGELEHSLPSCHEGESKDSGDFAIHSGKPFLRLRIALYITYLTGRFA